jgi:flagellar biosynthesis protein
MSRFRENIEKAVALQYNKSAPVVLAVARGDFVEKMLKLAGEKGITIYRDKDLADVLSVLKPGEEVPEKLFSAVAAVMAYCYNVNMEFKQKIIGSGIVND